MKKLTRKYMCLHSENVYSEQTMRKCLRHQIKINWREENKAWKNYKKMKREEND